MSARKSTDDRKTEILDVTLDLAFRVGPDHVTTGMIATQLGLTQPAIYKHFPKKEDIWRAATDRLCAMIRDNIDRTAQANLPPTHALRRLILGHLKLVCDTPALPEIMVTRDPSGNLTQTRRLILEAMTEFRATLAQYLSNAQQTGQLRPDLRSEDGVTLLIGIVQSLVLRLIVTRDTATLVPDGERLLDLQLTLFERQGKDI